MFAKTLKDVPLNSRKAVSEEASLAYRMGEVIAVWIENGIIHTNSKWGAKENGYMNPRNFIM